MTSFIRREYDTSLQARLELNLKTDESCSTRPNRFPRRERVVSGMAMRAKHQGSSDGVLALIHRVKCVDPYSTFGSADNEMLTERATR